VVLKEIAGMSIVQVSQVLGVSPATVKTRVHRGRLLLRNILMSTRPRKAVPRAIYDRSICMQLLQAKMDALDRGEEFPMQPDLLCERCRQVLASLDVGADACRHLRKGTMTPALKRRITLAVSQDALRTPR
jgi:hypothetical protein